MRQQYGVKSRGRGLVGDCMRAGMSASKVASINVAVAVAIPSYCAGKEQEHKDYQLCRSG